MRYARIVDGYVAEVIDPHPDGHKFEDCHHPDIVKQCVPIPANTNVSEHWKYQDGVFSEPDNPNAAGHITSAGLMQTLDYLFASAEQAGVVMSVDGEDVVFPTDTESRLRHSVMSHRIRGGLRRDGEIVFDRQKKPRRLTNDQASKLVDKIEAYSLAVTEHYMAMRDALSADPTVDLMAGWPSNKGD